MSNRRNFLKLAGIGLTGSVMRPFQAQAGRLNTKGQKLKIGILLPQSTEHPQYPGSFLNGLRCGINQHKAIQKDQIELVVESVNYGTPMIVKEKVQKLLTENNVDFISGLLNPEVAAHTNTLFKNAKVPALLASSGENYLLNELKHNPYLFFTSLGLYQAAYHSGHYAVEQYGKEIAIVSSFYDSGYDSLFTFRQGVEDAGGELMENYVADQNDEGFIEKTIAQIKQASPDCIYLFRHGQAAEDMLRALHFNKIKTPVITTAFVAEEHQLINLGEAANQLTYISSWNKNLELKENHNFISSYQKEYKKQPDSFSTLGYETGQIIYDTLSRCSSDFSAASMIEALKSCSLSSPRGPVHIDKQSGMIQNKLYINKVKASHSSLPTNQPSEGFQPVNEFSEQFAVLDNDYRSGWLNPYLFV